MFFGNLELFESFVEKFRDKIKPYIKFRFYFILYLSKASDDFKYLFIHALSSCMNTTILQYFRDQSYRIRNIIVHSINFIARLFTIVNCIDEQMA